MGAKKEFVSGDRMSVRSTFLLQVLLLACACPLFGQESTRHQEIHSDYFPAPDSLGGWRTLTDPEAIRRVAGMDRRKLDEAFEFARTTSAVPSRDLVVQRLGERNSQYSEHGTGLPEPKPGSNSLPGIHDGKMHQEDEDYANTRRMVLDAVNDYTAAGNALPGQIIEDPLHPNKLVRNEDRNGDGALDPFFLCGPGDPEGFLYRGSRNPDGTRNGDQMTLIRKLEEYGGNCIYFIAVRTHGGDAWKDKKNKGAIYPDDLHDPWVDQDPAKGLNEKMLDQWESWFTAMDRAGIVAYFFFYDDAIDVARQFGWSLDANGNLHPGEKKFIQEIVNRFKHHQSLIWCVMEEGQEIGANWQQHISKIGAAIREADNYKHVIASHQLSGNEFFHVNDDAISQFAIQTDKDSVRSTETLHRWMLTARTRSAGHYSLVMSEDWVQGTVSFPQGNRAEIRQRNWAAAMADAYVMVLGMEIDNTQPTWLNDCRNLQRFFEATTFNQMRPADQRALGETGYVLANDGYDYILYTSHAKGDLGLTDLSAGEYSLAWMDCASGKQWFDGSISVDQGDHMWRKPPDTGDEVALYIHREDQRPKGVQKDRKHGYNVTTAPLQATTNVQPVAASETIRIKANGQTDIQLKFTDQDGGPGPYSIQLTDPEHGKLTGTGNDRTYAPQKGYRGEDHFLWKVSDGVSESNLATIRLIVE
jgi:hypothetical protein